MRTEMQETRPRRRRGKPERVFDGLAVAGGIAVGTAFVVDSDAVPVPEYRIADDAVEAEKARFAAALARSQKQIRKLKLKSAALPAAAAEELGILLEAHLQMLTGSRVVPGVERPIAADRLNAQAPVQTEITRVAADFAALDDSYLPAPAR